MSPRNRRTPQRAAKNCQRPLGRRCTHVTQMLHAAWERPRELKVPELFVIGTDKERRVSQKQFAFFAFICGVLRFLGLVIQTCSAD
jgi:hypothetical protein